MICRKKPWMSRLVWRRTGERDAHAHAHGVAYDCNDALFPAFQLPPDVQRSCIECSLAAEYR